MITSPHQKRLERRIAYIYGRHKRRRWERRRRERSIKSAYLYYYAQEDLEPPTTREIVGVAGVRAAFYIAVGLVAAAFIILSDM